MNATYQYIKRIKIKMGVIDAAAMWSNCKRRRSVYFDKVIMAKNIASISIYS